MLWKERAFHHLQSPSNFYNILVLVLYTSPRDWPRLQITPVFYSLLLIVTHSTVLNAFSPSENHFKEGRLENNDFSVVDVPTKELSPIEKTCKQSQWSITTKLQETKQLLPIITFSSLGRSSEWNENEWLYFLVGTESFSWSILFHTWWIKAQDSLVSDCKWLSRKYSRCEGETSNIKTFLHNELVAVWEDRIYI